MTLKKIWNFIWHSNSLLSWVVNIILAFLIVKFLIYPGLGFALGGTSHPIVAVVSASMEHNNQNFDEWWLKNSQMYEEFNITKDEAEQWILKNGFEMGDIIFLKKSEDITEGDIIVFEGNSKNPIIHRVVDTWEEDETDYYQTKGDNNKKSYPELGETRIHEDKVIGKSLFKVPKIGLIKIVFAKAFGGL